MRILTSAILAAGLCLSAQTLTKPNTLCPVTGRVVENHLLYHHVTVRGRTYYVADREAGNRLKACPGCYLAKDGTPLNAK